MNNLDPVAIAQAKGHNEYVKSNLILDSSKVRQEHPYCFVRISDEIAGYGLLLPRLIDVRNNQGEIVGQTQKFLPHIICNDLKIHPVNQNFKDKQSIELESIPSHLPMRWSLESIDRYTNNDPEFTPLELKEIFSQMTHAYDQFITTHNGCWHKVQALWDLGTYFFTLFDFYPIMELRGAKGSGKTKIMKISRHFSFNPSDILINVSESSLFRETHDKRYTKYIDEAEKIWRFDSRSKQLLSDPRAELLNASVFKGAKVPRMEKRGNRFVCEYFSVYSPTVIGSIYGLKGATEDRAIIRTCVKNPKKDSRGDTEPPNKYDYYQDIRDNLYRTALNRWKEIESTYNNYNNESELSSRDLNIWKPILSIAKVIDDKLHEEILLFAEKQTNVKGIESLNENGFEFRVISAMHSLRVESQNSHILFKLVAERVDPDHPPSSRSITGVLDNLGLRDFKDHFEDGNGYKISLDEFDSLIRQTYPNIKYSSFSSVSSEEVFN